MSDGHGALLVDISNSRTKFVLARPDGVLEHLGILGTEWLDVAALEDMVGKHTKYDRACISSVVPKGAKALRRRLKCPLHFLGAASRLNITLDYRNPAALGADRIAAVMALAEQGDLPAIVVDAGTAVTCDVVAGRCGVPCHIGGTISPGLNTMIQALAARTAQLPAIPPELPADALGRDTVECLRSGVVFGFVDMVKGLVARLAGELETAPRIVLTGGDALLLAGSMPYAEVDTELVFKGLQVAAGLNP